MNFPNQNTAYGQSAAGYDEGLRQHMLRVYNYMGGALAVTGVVSFLVANSEPLMQAIFGSPLQWLFIFAPVILAMVFGFKIQTMSYQAAQTLFWVFSATMGVSLASIFLVYTGESIARTFFITAGVFGAMSLYGYTTKRDLTGMGSFMMMGLFGIIIASLVNIFMQSSGLSWAISFLSVGIFVGLTAYDTQKSRDMYYAFRGSEFVGKAALMSALSLYMDFINLFMALLRFMGDRR